MSFLTWIRNKFIKEVIPNPVPVSSIGQFSLNDVLIKYYADMIEISERGFSVQLVQDCCDKKRDTYKGYKWKYIIIK